jgi:hypothetical protein
VQKSGSAENPSISGEGGVSSILLSFQERPGEVSSILPSLQEIK